MVEVAIAERDRLRPKPGGSIDVAALRRAATDGIGEHGRDFAHAQRGADEHDHAAHDSTAWADRARGPGTYPGTPGTPSNPGTTTRTTEIGKSGGVSST
jgi:hypothetical protein